MQSIDNSPNQLESLKQYNLICYGLYLASFILGFTWLAAIIMNYVKRNEVRGTWLESHVEWQIKTFWVSLIGYILGFILCFILIGFAVLLGVFIWNMYRLIVGLIALTENRPIQ